MCGNDALSRTASSAWARGGLRARASISVLREGIYAVGVALAFRVILRGISVLLRSDDDNCAYRKVSSRVAPSRFLPHVDNDERERGGEIV